ncbi:uncharacterized protein LOC109495366 [Felis catus]|uniref:uncharacterized protein LOC109495366 n=1 Tax=Felis catus TaxID=9685 RepID=UPI001D19C70A|nr:uncharacterized protein LOC109495366 [Felis catus]
MVILCQVNVASVKEPEAALRGPAARPPADRAPGEQRAACRTRPPSPDSARQPRFLTPTAAHCPAVSRLCRGPPRRSHSTPNVTDKEAKRVGREHQPPPAERPAKGPESPTRPAPTLIQGSEKGTLAPLYDPTGTEAGVRLGPTSQQHNSKRQRQPAGPSPDGQIKHPIHTRNVAGKRHGHIPQHQPRIRATQRGKPGNRPHGVTPLTGHVWSRQARGHREHSGWGVTTTGYRVSFGGR